MINHKKVNHLYYNSRRSSVCLSVWHKCQAHTRDCTDFFGDLRSKVKVTSEVKVIPKLQVLEI